MSRVCRRSRAGSAPRWRRQARSTAGRPRPMRRIRPCPPSRPAGAQPGLQRRWHRGLHAARLDRRRRRRRAGQHAARPHVVPGDRGAASVRLGSAPGRRRVFRSEDQGLRWSYDAQVALGRRTARAVPQRDAGGGAGIARRRRAAALYRGWRPALAGGDHHGTGVAGCRRLRQGLRRAGRKDAWTGAGGPAGISLVAVSAGRNAGRRLELARARADRRASAAAHRDAPFRDRLPGRRASGLPHPAGGGAGAVPGRVRRIPC